MTLVEASLPGLEEPVQTCIHCQASYPQSEFNGNWKRCTKCRVTEGTQRERNLQMGRDSARRRNLRRLYDISPEEYDALRAGQQYRCAICGRHEDDLSTNNRGRPRTDGTPNAEAMKLHVDHDHDTNAIRGLLCYQCNSGLAYFRDDTERMTVAITYLNVGGFKS